MKFIGRSEDGAGIAPFPSIYIPILMSFETYTRRHAKELFDGLVDRLVKDLSTAARNEEDAALAVVRQEADAAAATARQEADAAVATARREAEAAAAARLEEVEERAAQARLDAERVAESQLAAARAEGEARLAAAQAMNAGLLESVEAARHEVKIFEARLQQLEEERTELLQARDESRAALETETRRVNELAESLEGALQDVNLAKQAASLARVEADACRQDQKLALDRIAAALRSIDRATSPGEIFDALLDPLAHDFAKVALFLVGAPGLKGWRARGLSATNDITKLVIPRTSDSPLARAAATRKLVQVTANGGEPLTGLWGNPVAGAVALPIHAGDCVIAVAYAEDSEETPSQNVGRRIAEILTKHAALRLTTKGKAQPRTGEAKPDPAGYSPARQASRLKIDERIEVTLDGSAGSLVDISLIGAQVLSPLALRPNRLVKMTLRDGENALGCKVRVMWARFEQPQGTSAAQYRVGVKFTDLEPETFEAFMAQYGTQTVHERTERAKLKDSA
jgi:hypothetical protein